MHECRTLSAICLLLLLIKLIFSAVLPQSWMLNKTISLFDCVSAASLKGVWLLRCVSSCGCSSDLSGVLCLMTSLSRAPAPCCCMQTTTIPPWFCKEHQGTGLLSSTVLMINNHKPWSSQSVHTVHAHTVSNQWPKKTELWIINVNKFYILYWSLL